MTPKEKATELVEWAIKYGASKEVAKLFATRTVDEIIKTLKDDDLYIGGETNIDEIIIFWQEVKRELAEI